MKNKIESDKFKKEFKDNALQELNIFRKEKEILYKDDYLEKDQAIECSARTKLFKSLVLCASNSKEIIKLYYGLTVFFMDIDKKNNGATK